MFKNIHLWIATKLFFINHRRDIQTNVNSIVAERIDIDCDGINNLFDFNDCLERKKIIKLYFTELAKQSKEKVKEL